LKPIQIRYRLWYMLRKRLRNAVNHSYPLSIFQKGQPLTLTSGLGSPVSLSSRTFTFLNQSHTFGKAINWNYRKHGKLWAYNLNYFDYLLQEELTKEQGLKLIYAFIDQIEENREGMEPYPISLRGMNWIKFLSKYKIDDQKIDASLYAQYQILRDNIEYHLLGNHLMENGCSLLFGAYYFKNQALLKTAVKILDEQLSEQVLPDGGHFERSTMYHLIMLERLLDCYNLVTNNDWCKDEELKGRLKEKIELMLGWAVQLSVNSYQSSGKRALPLLNDSAVGVASSFGEVEEYAGRLGLQPKKITLS